MKFDPDIFEYLKRCEIKAWKRGILKYYVLDERSEGLLQGYIFKGYSLQGAILSFHGVVSANPYLEIYFFGQEPRQEIICMHQEGLQPFL